MRRRLAVLAAIGAAVLAATAAALPPPSVTGSSALVGNGATGDLLLGVRQAQKVPIASITKVMTALVVLENTDPDDVVRVGGPAPTIGGSTIGLRAGERLSVRDLLTAVLVQSANDAAYALAFHVGKGSVPRFVSLMNAKARALGLRDTRFVRPDGLDAAGHYSSARDLFKLARVAMHKPLFRQLVRVRTTTIAGGRVLRNWNDLLFEYPGTIGVKTGHTSAAGWSEVAAARRNGITLYAVLLGGSEPLGPQRRSRRDARLGLRPVPHRTRGRRAAGPTPRPWFRTATSASPWSPRSRRISLVRVGLPLVERVVAPAMIDPPVARGQELGEVQVLLDGQVVARQPLVAAESGRGAGIRRSSRLVR